MQILFRCPDGSSAAVEISQFATVGALKHAIENEHFFPHGEQQLILKNECLSDEMILADCGLEDADSLDLEFDVLGGSHGSSRYKKARSCMRWKWKKKRTRRLQRKRRKMRLRAR